MVWDINVDLVQTVPRCTLGLFQRNPDHQCRRRLLTWHPFFVQSMNHTMIHSSHACHHYRNHDPKNGFHIMYNLFWLALPSIWTVCISKAMRRPEKKKGNDRNVRKRFWVWELIRIAQWQVCASRKRVTQMRLWEKNKDVIRLGFFWLNSF